MGKKIFHIAMPEEWDAARSAANYRAASLETEGFIHCSFEDQLDAVLGRYYSGVGKVNILEIDPTRLTSELIEEPSTNDEIYPHIYGPLNLDAVVGVTTREAPEG